MTEKNQGSTSIDDWVFCDSRGSVAVNEATCQRLLSKAMEVLDNTREVLDNTRETLDNTREALDNTREVLQQTRTIQSDLSEKFTEIKTILQQQPASNLDVRNSNRSWRSYMNDPYLPYLGTNIFPRVSTNLLVPNKSALSEDNSSTTRIPTNSVEYSSDSDSEVQ